MFWITNPVTEFIYFDILWQTYIKYYSAYIISVLQLCICICIHFTYRRLKF